MPFACVDGDVSYGCWDVVNVNGEGCDAIVWR